MEVATDTAVGANLVWLLKTREISAGVFGVQLMLPLLRLVTVSSDWIKYPAEANDRTRVARFQFAHDLLDHVYSHVRERKEAENSSGDYLDNCYKTSALLWFMLLVGQRFEDFTLLRTEMAIWGWA